MKLRLSVKLFSITILLFVKLSCTRILPYTPVSGAEIIIPDVDYPNFKSFKKVSGNLSILISATLSSGPSLVMKIENNGNSSVKIPPNEITAKIIEGGHDLVVENCFKPADPKFFSDGSEYKVPCEETVLAGTTQIRFIKFQSYPYSMRQPGQSTPEHNLQIKTNAAFGLSLDLLFKYERR